MTLAPTFICRNVEQFGAGALFVIEEHRPTYFVEGSLPGFSTADLMDVVGAMFKTWGKHLDVVGRAVTSAAKANLLVRTAKIDGRGNVLADCQLPQRGLFQQLMRLDYAEDVVLAINPPAGKLDLQSIVNHEGGHFLGYQHWPFGAPPELMEPAIQFGLRDPQPTEIAWGVKTIGPAKTPVPGPISPGTPLPPVIGESVGLEVIITATKEMLLKPGDVLRAKGAANRT